MLLRLLLMCVLLAVGMARAVAWESTGHLIINGAAMAALPPTVPAFLRTPDAIAEVRMLGPELDRLKGSGNAWDSEFDPGHYVDIGDDGLIAGAVSLDALPPTREAYDTALRAKGTDQYKQGFSPYTIIEGEEQLSKDFAYWRVDVAGEQRAAPTDRAFFTQDRRWREQLILHDIGVWGHYIADGSQPLHVTIHFNGWGNYPNPKEYSQSRTLHARFEGAFVRAAANAERVRAGIPPYAPCGCTAVQRVARFLGASLAAVPAVYELERQNAIDNPTPASTAFLEARLAAGAAAMRDLIVDAWTDSANNKVGYPPQPVSDFESGKSVPVRGIVDGE